MFTCNQCSHSSTTKLGKCPSCNDFGTFFLDQSKSSLGSKKAKRRKEIMKKGAALYESGQSTSAIVHPITHNELSRVLGQGIQQAGVYLLAGEPGIGKSTLMLQIIAEIQSCKIAYFSAEEHAAHVDKRRLRLMDGSKRGFSIYHASKCEDILATVQEHRYDIVIVDSIQTIHSGLSDSPAGSPNQVRQSSDLLTNMAKTLAVATFVIGHVTKGGEIAGPKYLEHIVDVVMYLEGEKDGELRYLRTKKNRFGPTDDVGIFEMKANGLQPVYDLQERIISQITTTNPGSVLSVAVDNGRPVLVQIEALLNKTSGKYPFVVVFGVETKRVEMILAILAKYLQIDTSFTDVFINIPGEVSYSDSGLDLGIAAAIVSQYLNKSIEKRNIFLGEIMLSGQIKDARQHTRREKELKGGFLLQDKKSCPHISQLQSCL